MSCFCVWRALSKCDAGLFNKLVGIYPELAVHERALDTVIDLFKKDQVPLNDFSSLLSPCEFNKTIRNNDFQRNTALQHCFDIVWNIYNIVPTLQRCVALKIVVANHTV